MEVTIPPNVPNTNSGHGWVWTRPDGLLARCGGPAVCRVCKADQVALDATKIRPIEDLKREAVEQALAHHGGNRTHTAAALGITVRTLQRWIKAWGLTA